MSEILYENSPEKSIYWISLNCKLNAQQLAATSGRKWKYNLPRFSFLFYYSALCLPFLLKVLLERLLQQK